MAKVANSALKDSFDVCFARYQSLHNLGREPLVQEAFALRKATYRRIASTLNGAINREAILDLFSGDSLVPATLAHAGKLKRFTAHDAYLGTRERGTAELGKTLIRSLNLGSKASFVSARIDQGLDPKTFATCPESVTVINSGLFLPRRLRALDSVQSALDCPEAPHILREEFEADMPAMFGLLAEVLPRQTEVLFVDAVPKSKWTMAEDLKTRSAQSLEEATSGTPWAIAQVDTVEGQPMVFGRLTKVKIDHSGI